MQKVHIIYINYYYYTLICRFSWGKNVAFFEKAPIKLFRALLMQSCCVYYFFLFKNNLIRLLWILDIKCKQINLLKTLSDSQVAAHFEKFNENLHFHILKISKEKDEKNKWRTEFRKVALFLPIFAHVILTHIHDNNISWIFKFLLRIWNVAFPLFLSIVGNAICFKWYFSLISFL